MSQWVEVSITELMKAINSLPKQPDGKVSRKEYMKAMRQLGAKSGK